MIMLKSQFMLRLPLVPFVGGPGRVVEEPLPELPPVYGGRPALLTKSFESRADLSMLNVLIAT